MTHEETQWMIIQGLVADLPAAERAKVNKCADKIRSLVRAAGNEGHIALSWVGAEMAAKD